MLDLGRALATSPRLLLVDELAAGLNPAELARMSGRLRALAQEGMALLVVEHLMGFIDSVTDRVIVLNAGRETAVVSVTNRGDRPIQVGSHYHLIETNRALVFDRAKAYGMLSLIHI